jgi:aminopeptidase N
MLKGAANSHNPYGKPSLGYLAIKDLLGDEAFRKCLNAYIDRWHGKHPQPWDFFATFNDVSGRNLDWFWNNWFFERYYIDFGVRGVTRSNDSYAVVIDNVGGLAAPFDLELTYGDGSTQSLHETPAVWMADQKRARVLIHSAKSLRELRLTSGIFMDADTSNNRWAAR